MIIPNLYCNRFPICISTDLGHVDLFTFIMSLHTLKVMETQPRREADRHWSVSGDIYTNVP